jgi:hypothetical protein
MGNNFYITNRHKLLFMVKELHKRGFGKIRVIPSLSPSGMYWRCSFVNETKVNSFIASNWIHDKENKNSEEEIKLTTKELAELFLKENFEFLEDSKGEHKEYENWYSEMLEQLSNDELPYAWADWDIPNGVWETTKGKSIKTLPDECK